MRLGFPNYPRADALEQIEWIAANGFDFVDLFLEPDRAAIGAFSPAQIRGALDRLGLGATGHLAWYLPIGSPMEQLRGAAVEIAKEYLGAFADAGVPAILTGQRLCPAGKAQDRGAVAVAERNRQ